MGLVVGLDAFLVFHVVLHLANIRHPEYRYRSVFSWALILAAGVCWALDPVTLI